MASTNTLVTFAGTVKVCSAPVKLYVHVVVAPLVVMTPVPQGVALSAWACHVSPDPDAPPSSATAISSLTLRVAPPTRHRAACDVVPSLLCSMSHLSFFATPGTQKTRRMTQYSRPA